MDGIIVSPVFKKHRDNECSHHFLSVPSTSSLIANLAKSAINLIFVLFDLIIYIPSTIFQLCRYRSSWVEPVLTRINVSCSRTQPSDSGEAQTCDLLVSSQVLYH